MWNLSFGAGDQSDGAEGRYSRLWLGEELRAEQVIDLVADGEYGASQPLKNKEARHQQTAIAMQE